MLSPLTIVRLEQPLDVDGKSIRYVAVPYSPRLCSPRLSTDTINYIYDHRDVIGMGNSPSDAYVDMLEKSQL